MQPRNQMAAVFSRMRSSRANARPFPNGAASGGFCISCSAVGAVFLRSCGRQDGVEKCQSGSVRSAILFGTTSSLSRQEPS
jgi:hypothetical protein